APTSLLARAVGQDAQAPVEGRARARVGAGHGPRQPEQLGVLGEGAGVRPQDVAQDFPEGEQVRRDGGRAPPQELGGDVGEVLGLPLEAGDLAEPRAETQIDQAPPDGAVGARLEDHIVLLEVVVGEARQVELSEPQRQVMDAPQEGADGGRVQEHGLEGFPTAELHQESWIVLARGKDSRRPSEAVQTRQDIRLPLEQLGVGACRSLLDHGVCALVADPEGPAVAALAEEDSLGHQAHHFSLEEHRGLLPKHQRCGTCFVEFLPGFVETLQQLLEFPFQAVILRALALALRPFVRRLALAPRALACRPLPLGLRFALALAGALGRKRRGGSLALHKGELVLERNRSQVHHRVSRLGLQGDQGRGSLLDLWARCC
ncbi:hypothetical protein C7M84_014358, partial [Penaeus vannamei]